MQLSISCGELSTSQKDLFRSGILLLHIKANKYNTLLSEMAATLHRLLMSSFQSSISEHWSHKSTYPLPLMITCVFTVEPLHRGVKEVGRRLLDVWTWEACYCCCTANPWGVHIRHSILWLSSISLMRVHAYNALNCTALQGLSVWKKEQISVVWKDTAEAIFLKPNLTGSSLFF